MHKGAARLHDALIQLGAQGTPAHYASLLRRCGNAKVVSDGRLVHAHIIKSGLDRDRFVRNLLIQMYGDCGSLEDARAVFDRIRRRNLFSWNIMIVAYAQNGQLQDARSVFEEMPQRDVVSWNAMIAAYAQNGQAEESLKYFELMRVEGVIPDRISFITILDACGSLGALSDGKLIHGGIAGSGLGSDVVVGTALINMYGKCGSVDDARIVFEKMPQRDVVSWNTLITAYACNGYLKDAKSVFDKMSERNVVSWNSMISAYAQNEHAKDAVELFQRMQLEGVNPDKGTFVSTLDACASLAALAKGKFIHSNVVYSGFESDVIVGTALVNMYAKCGSLDDARRVFDQMNQRNVVSWTAMIAAYAQNGYGKESLELFQQMHSEGVKPNRITFVSILSACSHAGLLDDGWRYFNSMRKDPGMVPAVEHYGCMIDLLGRSGKLDGAEILINNMALAPDAVAWTNLLGACRIYGDVERGAHAAEHIFELDPKHAAPYVLLSNIYAAAGKWDNVAKVRKEMKDRGVRKPPGHSCIEINDRFYEFVAGGASCPQEEEIHAVLGRLSRKMEEAGYVPNSKALLHKPQEEKREFTPYYHSEKLAIAFGLINTFPGTSLRIIKNLRVCSDCHTSIKFISHVVGRKIIVRDASRFHHFEEGICSCEDYW